MIALFAVLSFGGTFSNAADIADKILLYIPNRIIDAFDVFSLELGAGPSVGAQLQFTEAFQFGAGVGATARAVKDINRQYGGCLQNGWSAGFTCIKGENVNRTDTTRWVKPFWEDFSGFPEPSQEIYNFYDGAKDYWAIGGAGGLLIDAAVYLHPVEIADFITGFFFIDLKGDDITFEDFE